MPTSQSKLEAVLLIPGMAITRMMHRRLCWYAARASAPRQQL